MPITFNQGHYQKVLDLIAVIRSEGQYVFSCKSQSNECWISFCGMDLCFVNHTATRLKSRDLDIVISIPTIANDNIIGEAGAGETAMPAPAKGPTAALNFLNGSVEILSAWHREIVAFRPGHFDPSPVTA